MELIEKDLNFEKKLEGSFEWDEIVDIKCWNNFFFIFPHFGKIFHLKKKNYKFEIEKLVCEIGL